MFLTYNVSVYKASKWIDIIVVWKCQKSPHVTSVRTKKRPDYSFFITRHRVSRTIRTESPPVSFPIFQAPSFPPLCASAYCAHRLFQHMSLLLGDGVTAVLAVVGEVMLDRRTTDVLLHDGGGDRGSVHGITRTAELVSRVLISAQF